MSLIYVQNDPLVVFINMIWLSTVGLNINISNPQFVCHFTFSYFRGLCIPDIDYRNQTSFVCHPLETRLILLPCRMEALLQGLVTSLSSIHSHQSCWVHVEVKEDKGKQKSLGKTLKQVSS